MTFWGSKVKTSHIFSGSQDPQPPDLCPAYPVFAQCRQISIVISSTVSNHRIVSVADTIFTFLRADLLLDNGTTEIVRLQAASINQSQLISDVNKTRQRHTSPRPDQDQDIKTATLKTGHRPRPTDQDSDPQYWTQTKTFPRKMHNNSLKKSYNKY